MRQEDSSRENPASVPSKKTAEAEVIRKTEIAPPYPHNSPNEQELDPLKVHYTSVCPPVVTDGTKEIKLPRQQNQSR